jgi:hypothetical protein
MEFDAEAWIILLAMRVKCPRLPIFVGDLVFVGFDCTWTHIQLIIKMHIIISLFTNGCDKPWCTQLPDLRIKRQLKPLSYHYSSHKQLLYHKVQIYICERMLLKPGYWTEMFWLQKWVPPTVSQECKGFHQQPTTLWQNHNPGRGDLVLPGCCSPSRMTQYSPPGDATYCWKGSYKTTQHIVPSIKLSIWSYLLSVTSTTAIYIQSTRQRQTEQIHNKPKEIYG